MVVVAEIKSSVLPTQQRENVFEKIRSDFTVRPVRSNPGLGGFARLCRHVRFVGDDVSRPAFRLKAEVADECVLVTAVDDAGRLKALFRITRISSADAAPVLALA